VPSEPPPRRTRTGHPGARTQGPPRRTRPGHPGARTQATQAHAPRPPRPPRRPGHPGARAQATQAHAPRPPRRTRGCEVRLGGFTMCAPTRACAHVRMRIRARRSAARAPTCLHVASMHAAACGRSIAVNTMAKVSSDMPMRSPPLRERSVASSHLSTAGGGALAAHWRRGAARRGATQRGAHGAKNRFESSRVWDQDVHPTLAAAALQGQRERHCDLRLPRIAVAGPHAPFNTRDLNHSIWRSPATWVGGAIGGRAQRAIVEGAIRILEHGEGGPTGPQVVHARQLFQLHAVQARQLCSEWCHVAPPRGGVDPTSQTPHTPTGWHPPRYAG